MKTTNEDSPGTEERGEVKTLPPVKLKRLRRAKLLRMCQSNENFYDYHSQQQTLINFQKSVWTLHILQFVSVEFSTPRETLKRLQVCFLYF